MCPVSGKGLAGAAIFSVTPCRLSESNDYVKRARKPSIALLLVRVVVISVLITLLAFAVSLFFGITGIVLADMIHGGGINLAHAYRNIALPIALVTLLIAFVASLTVEIRQYRRARASVTAESQRAA